MNRKLLACIVTAVLALPAASSFAATTPAKKPAAKTHTVSTVKHKKVVHKTTKKAKPAAKKKTQHAAM